MATGYQNAVPPYLGTDRDATLDERTWRRELRQVTPPGRALDLDDLHELIDEGNQTNRAILMRKRILARFVGELPAGVLLSPAELEKVEDHAAAARAVDMGNRSGIDRPAEAAAGSRAPVDEWPPVRR